MTNKQKSLYKAISYRIISVAITFVISYFITGSLKEASAIVSIDVVLKLAVYYYHERLWHKIYKKYRVREPTNKWQYESHKQ